MHDVKTTLYLDESIDESLEQCAKRLNLTKSFIVNVIFKELFKQADPDDYFFNRVVLCPEFDSAEPTAKLPQ